MTTLCDHHVGTWFCNYPRDHPIHRVDFESSAIWRTHPFVSLKEEPMTDPTRTDDVLAAAIAWSDSYERVLVDSNAYVVLSPEGRRLHDAVQRFKGPKPTGEAIDRMWEEVKRLAEEAERADAPSEDPRESLGRRVAEAIGGDEREITVIIIGDID